MNKKLQVFVSSTFTDLIEERQAAVEAILDAGHIPAGMELFKAGNESQLKTIYKWIDESDVYMLILGGRYGSVESKSGKSYTQLEYEYALSKDIPVFAVVLSQSFLTNKINSLGLNNIMEQNAPDKYQNFKLLVMSKIIKEVDDYKDIKIAIYSTLTELLNNSEYKLIGWTRNSKKSLIVDDTMQHGKTIHFIKFGKLTYNDLYLSLSNTVFKLPSIIYASDNSEDIWTTALELFVKEIDLFKNGISNFSQDDTKSLYFFNEVCDYYTNLKLLKKESLSLNKYIYNITKAGIAFYSLYDYIDNN